MESTVVLDAMRCAFAKGNAAPRVLLFGLGTWGVKSYLGVLLELHREGVIRLGLMDRGAEPPEKVKAMISGEDIPYFPQGADAGHWEIAFVVVTAEAEREVAVELMNRVPELQTLVLEKPGGQNIQDAMEIAKTAEEKGVQLLLADHYNLRPAVRAFAANREALMAMIGQPLEVSGWLTEAQEAGPSGSVAFDLLPHLLNVLDTLLPGSSLNGVSARRRPYTGSRIDRTDNGCDVLARLTLGSGVTIPLDMHVSKGTEDKKAILIKGERAEILLDFISHKLEVSVVPSSWNYKDLARDLAASSREPSQ